jgi:hypothetical protein
MYMEPHEIVGSVLFGDEDALSEVISADIVTDGLPDDPRLYLSFDIGGEHAIVAFPLKEIYKVIEKEILSS